MAVNIVSLNVRGLRDNMKRRSIFENYRNRCDILCLQETHSDEESIQMWKNEWGGQLIVSHGTSTARGVMILVKKSSKIDILSEYSYPGGRSCAGTFLIENTAIHLVNIYGPNKDSPEFYTDICKEAQKNHSSLIIIGDYNAVLNPSLDTKKGVHNNVKATCSLRNQMDEYDLEDVWRVRNPEKKRFSWWRKGCSDQASRLDFAVVSQGLCDMVHDTFYLTGLHSDHSAFFLDLK